MCPKIEIMDSGAISVPGTPVAMASIVSGKAYEIATLGSATANADWTAVGGSAKVGLRFVASGAGTAITATGTVIDLFPGTVVSGGTDWPVEVAADKLSATKFLVRTGEVMKGAGTPRAAQTGYSFIAPSNGDLLETDSGLTTNAADHVLAATPNTVGFLSTNQVTFEALSPVIAGTPKTFGVRVTNPAHDSLPLDVRSKVLTFADAMTVIPQTISGYTPGSIGRISTGNTLVIKGLGFQKGSIVQLGVMQKEKSVHAEALLADRLGCTYTAGPPATWACDASVTANGLLATTNNFFISKSHILNRTTNTLTKLGTWYAPGYNSEITTGLTGDNSAFPLESSGLLSKDLPAAAGSAVPFFSYDHNAVEVNTDKQITIKGITVTAVADAPTTAVAKVFNPDGTVAYAALFNIAAPGIEQIVQVEGTNNWLSAAQGRTVTLKFRSTIGNTFQKTAGGLPPKVAVSCYALATDADKSRGVKDLITGSTVSAAGKPFDPCKDLGTGAIDTGISQIGDLAVSADGKDVTGTFAIAANAKVALRKFTMTNGDAAVFNNYFSISKSPTFAQISYPSGTSRMHDDDKATLSPVSSGTSALTGLVGVTSNVLSPTDGFNVVGKLPRATTRRVLITGSAFVRGSFAPMPDPLKTTTAAAVSGTECQTCFGARSDSTDGLVGAAHAATTTPKITFNTPGVKLLDDSGNNGTSPHTTVVKDAGTALNMSTKVLTTPAQSTDIEAPYIATQRLSAIITVDTTAPAGPVTMTITNPDGGQVIVPSAFMIDGAPTVDTTLDSVYSVLANNNVSNASVASIKQGAIKTGSNAIFIYGSGFFATYKANGTIDQAPQVSVSGTGVRVTSVRLSNINPGTTYAARDSSMPDTVLRVELAAESTAPTTSAGNLRDITVVLPDGQSVTMKAAFSVNAP